MHNATCIYYYHYRFSRTVSITNQGQDYDLDSSYYILRAYRTTGKAHINNNNNNNYYYYFTKTMTK